MPYFFKSPNGGSSKFDGSEIYTVITSVPFKLRHHMPLSVTRPIGTKRTRHFEHLGEWYGSTVW